MAKKSKSQDLPPERIMTRNEEAACLVPNAAYGLEAAVSILATPKGPDADVLENTINSTKLALGLLSSKTPAELKINWADVDWAKNPAHLAKLVVLSSNKNAILSAPLPWLTILPPPRDPDDFDRSVREKMWLAENLILTGKPLFPHVSSRYKVTDIERRTREMFWGEVFKANVLNPKDKIEVVFSDKKMSIFSTALYYGSASVLKFCDPVQCITDKESAEESLFTVFGGHQFYRFREKEEDQVVVDLCLSFSPDLSKKFFNPETVERYSCASRAAFEIYKTKTGSDPNASAALDDFLASSLGETVFRNITDGATTKSLRLYFLSWMEEMKEADQVKFLEKLEVHQADCYATMCDKKFVSDFASRLKGKAKDKFFDIFVSDKVFMDDEYVAPVLAACKKIKIQKDKKYLLDFLDMCEHRQSDNYRNRDNFSPSQKEAFVALFPEPLAEKARAVCNYFTKNTDDFEKMQIWSEVMRQEIKNDTARPKKQIKKM